MRASDFLKKRVAKAHKRGRWHAVNVSGKCRHFRIRVWMRVYPDDAERTMRKRSSCDSAYCHRVVSSERQDEITMASRLLYGGAGIAGGHRYFLKIFRRTGARRVRRLRARYHFRFRYVEMERCDDFLEPLIQEITRCFREPAFIRTKFDGNTDDADTTALEFALVK